MAEKEIVINATIRLTMDEAVISHLGRDLIIQRSVEEVDGMDVEVAPNMWATMHVMPVLAV